MLVDAVTKEKPRVVGLLARWPGIRSCEAWERFGTGPKDIKAVGRVMKGRQLLLFPEDLRDTAEVRRQSSGVSHRGLGGHLRLLWMRRLKFKAMRTQEHSRSVLGNKDWRWVQSAIPWQPSHQNLL